jgi:Zn-dependent alcohol dehydrogenase
MSNFNQLRRKGMKIKAAIVKKASDPFVIEEVELDEPEIMKYLCA